MSQKFLSYDNLIMIKDLSPCLSNSSMSGCYHKSCVILSSNTLSFGKDNVAGLKGYDIVNWDDTEQCYFIDDIIPVNCDGWIYSLQLGNNYDKNGTVTSIQRFDTTEQTKIYVTNYISCTNLNEGTTMRIWFPEHPEQGNLLMGTGAMAFGWSTKATHLGTFTEGWNTHAYGKYAHSEGNSTQAAYGAHSEGVGSLASGLRSHAQNYNTISSGENSTAIGQQTQSNGLNSFSQGFQTKANGVNSLSSGKFSYTDYSNSAVFGLHSKAGAEAQCVVGRYNAINSGSLFIVGNGNSDTLRSNALQVNVDGTCTVGADPTENLHVTTKQYVDRLISQQNTYIDNSVNSINNITNLQQGSDVGSLYMVGANGAGKHSIALNYGTTASGMQSIAVGKNTVASNTNAFSEGYTTIASGLQSHAGGAVSYCTHDNSLVFGYCLNSSRQNQAVFGEYNGKIEDAMLIVGNGQQGTVSNAFTVLKSGRATIGALPETYWNVVNKGYCDAKVEGYCDSKIKDISGNTYNILVVDEIPYNANDYTIYILKG